MPQVGECQHLKNRHGWNELPILSNAEKISKSLGLRPLTGLILPVIGPVRTECMDQTRFGIWDRAYLRQRGFDRIFAIGTLHMAPLKWASLMLIHCLGRLNLPPPPRGKAQGNAVRSYR